MDSPSVVSVMETIAEKKIESAIVRKRVEEGLLLILPNCPQPDPYIKSMAVKLGKGQLYDHMFFTMQEEWHNQFRQSLLKEYANCETLVRLEEEILKLNTWLSNNV
jgi:hypothetical protein